MPARLNAESVTARVPAKINLLLSVGAARPDGFHEIVSIFHAIGLYDEVTVTAADELAVSVVGDSADEVPTDETNLAARAAIALASQAGLQPSVDIRIRKGIPVAGGCAGGSADAAAALLACDELWGLGSPRARLAEVAASLGSDVPFCLVGGTSLGTGRGEQLTPVLGAGIYSWVLALADGGLSTPAVYAELDRQRETGPVAMAADPAEALGALRSGRPEALGRALSNDLQEPAFALRPELRGVLEAGLELGALGGVVSGSGPTLAFLAADETHAGELADSLTAQPGCRAVRLADGPVTGARVVRSR